MSGMHRERANPDQSAYPGTLDLSVWGDVRGEETAIGKHIEGSEIEPNDKISK